MRVNGNAFCKFSLAVIAFFHLSSGRFRFSVGAAKSNSKESKPTRIAVIGGGISGSFVTKYLSDYDVDCTLDITVFDPPPSDDNQGSRVASHTLKDGTVVETGASIIFGDNKLVNDMIDGSIGMTGEEGNDETLRKTLPHTDGIDSDDPEIRNGLGVYDGRSSTGKPFPLLLSHMDDKTKMSTMMWRYNLDLFLTHRATQSAQEAFHAVYEYLENDDDESCFFDSPNDIWEALGLSHEASVNFEKYLEGIGVVPYMTWWKHLKNLIVKPWLLGEQGVVQSELYEPINICNNNQINSEMTGLAGLVNAAASTGDLFAIEGGNSKLISSAFKQATRNHEDACLGKRDPSETIKRVPTKIQTLVSSDFKRRIELFGEDGKIVDLDSYDIVVVATPLQFSGIEFMGKGSVFDDGLLYYLPLNEMVDSENSDANLHEHIHSLGGDLHLPSSAKRPYTQVITTLVANADLQPSYFQIENGKDLPRSILFTEQGRKQTGISSISQITRDLYKVFSSSKLSDELIHNVFGENAFVEHSKIWGGRRGGATPSFHGAGEASKSTNFLLYNGGRQDEDNEPSKTHAIYYTNAMESAVSAIEIAAIGSKSVAKLIARRLGLINPKRRNTNGEEL